MQEWSVAAGRRRRGATHGKDGVAKPTGQADFPPLTADHLASFTSQDFRSCGIEPAYQQQRTRISVLSTRDEAAGLPSQRLGSARHAPDVVRPQPSSRVTQCQCAQRKNRSNLLRHSPASTASAHRQVLEICWKMMLQPKSPLGERLIGHSTFLPSRHLALALRRSSSSRLLTSLPDMTQCSLLANASHSDPHALQAHARTEAGRLCLGSQGITTVFCYRASVTGLILSSCSVLPGVDPGHRGAPGRSSTSSSAWCRRRVPLRLSHFL